MSVTATRYRWSACVTAAGALVAPLCSLLVLVPHGVVRDEVCSPTMVGAGGSGERRRKRERWLVLVGDVGGGGGWWCAASGDGFGEGWPRMAGRRPDLGY